MNDVHAGPDRRSAADVRASLTRSMEDLRVALGKLERVARSELDLGKYVSEHALPVLLGGFVGGALLGAITVRNPRYVVMMKPRRRAIFSGARRFKWR